MLGYIGAPVCTANLDVITSSGVDGVPACSANTECSTDKELYLYDAFKDNSYDERTPIGVAKDGHVIYGPFNDAGNRYCSKPDVCNGRYDSDGYYEYITTSYAPFGPACWGPASSTSYSQTCSSKPRWEEPDECWAKLVMLSVGSVAMIFVN